MYTLKIVKSLVRFLGKAFRRNNMKLLTRIDVSVRHHFSDTWFYDQKQGFLGAERRGEERGGERRGEERGGERRGEERGGEPAEEEEKEILALLEPFNRIYFGGPSEEDIDDVINM